MTHTKSADTASHKVTPSLRCTNHNFYGKTGIHAFEEITLIGGLNEIVWKLLLVRYSWELKFIHDFADKCLSAQDDLAMILQSLFAVIDSKRVTGLP